MSEPIKVFRRSPFITARGFPSEGDGRRMAVTFDGDMFMEINSMAERRGITFAEMVRRLIKTALKTAQGKPDV